MYAPSTLRERHAMWREWQENNPPEGTPWLVIGDFNEVANHNEKRGGRIFRPGQCTDFNNWMANASMADLGFSGNPCTWNNARQGLEMIRERLDIF